MNSDEFSFLFRQSDGTISASIWRRWTIVLTGLCLVLYVGWRLLSPWTGRDLATQGLFAWRPVAAFAYLVVFAAIVLLAQVSQYYLSAKRFRAKNFAPAWASVWPLSALVAGSMFWAQPNFFGLMPAFLPWLFLLASLAAFAAQFYELGFRRD